MNISDIINSRHSYRGKYKNIPVPRQDLITIMEAGLAAPSGCNKQTTSLIAIDDAEVLKKVQACINPPIAETAPAAICVLTRRINAYRDKCFAIQDYSAAIENMLLAITALGYQSCWYEGHITDEDKIGYHMAQVLNVPDEYELVCFLPVGIAEEEVKPQRKKPFEKRAWFNSFPQELIQEQNELLKKQSAYLPAYLIKPTDPISLKIFGNNLVTVKNEACHYQIEVNPEYQNVNPTITSFSDSEINEIHIYSKSDIPSWYAVSTKKAPEVEHTPLKNSVTSPHMLSNIMKTPYPMVNIPFVSIQSGYESIQLHELGSFEEYNKIKNIDENVVFCHVFSFRGKLYKDYILCARKKDISWKVECYIEAKTPELSPLDFAPPGFLFGSFDIL